MKDDTFVQIFNDKQISEARNLLKNVFFRGIDREHLEQHRIRLRDHVTKHLFAVADKMRTGAVPPIEGRVNLSCMTELLDADILANGPGFRAAMRLVELQVEALERRIAPDTPRATEVPKPKRQKVEKAIEKVTVTPQRGSLHLVIALTGDELLTEKEAARLLNKRPKTLANLRSLGQGPSTIKFGDQVYYMKSMLTTEPTAPAIGAADDGKIKHDEEGKP